MWGTGTHEHLCGDRLFYCFVEFMPPDAPELFPNVHSNRPQHRQPLAGRSTVKHAGPRSNAPNILDLSQLRCHPGFNLCRSDLPI